MTPAGLHLSDDLLFASKVSATARAHGLEVMTARSTAQAIELARRSPPAAVLVDLQNPGLELGAFLADLKAVCPTSPSLIAYGSHLAKEALTAARTAGLGRVMSRSKFVALLEAELPGWLAGEPA